MSRRALVLYEFQGEPQNSELIVYENESITVLCEDAGEGWVEAAKDTGEQGLVPAAYIEYQNETYEITDNQGGQPAAVAYNDNLILPAQQTNHAHFEGSEWSDYDSDEESRQARPSVDYDDDSRASHQARSNTIKKSMNRFTPYVKSGAEDFILGKEKDQTVPPGETITIVTTNNIDLVWKAAQPISVEITEPIKKQKFKGMKSFMSYHITPHTTNLTVERRYKQFDWFHDRLGEKFPCFIIPPLPEKAVVGKFQGEFIEQRRDKLECWLNRIGRHPIIAHSNVTKHFLQCQDEKAWKEGKRVAESDKTSRSGFFLTVQCEAQLPDTLASESYVASFSTFSKKMESNLDRLVKQNDDYTNKMMGGIKHMYSKYASIFKEMGELYDTGPLTNSKPVNSALISTGRCYQEISDVYDNQPRYDAHVLSESIREYQGILGAVPDMLHVHKGTAQKVKDFTRSDEKDAEEEAQVLKRYSTISAAVMAEVNHFHESRNTDFNRMMRDFLSSQLDFHRNVAQKLEHALSLYPEPNNM